MSKIKICYSNMTREKYKDQSGNDWGEIRQPASVIPLPGSTVIFDDIDLSYVITDDISRYCYHYNEHGENYVYIPLVDIE